MKYTGDTVVVETNDDIKELCEKYNCKNIDELDELLWYNYGITLKDNRKNHISYYGNQILSN